MLDHLDRNKFYKLLLAVVTAVVWSLFTTVGAHGAYSNYYLNPTPISPDGSKVAFVSDRDDGEGSESIYVANVDGSGAVKVSPASKYGNEYPQWSPDGSKLFFYASYNKKGYVVNADGSSLIQVLGSDSTSLQSVTWSPDSSKLVAYQKDGSTYAIKTVNADGSDLTTLYEGTFFSGEYYDSHYISKHGGWAPNSSKVAFSYYDYEADREILVIAAADGSSQTTVSDSTGRSDSRPLWSLDSTAVVFASETADTSDIYQYDLGSETSTPLVDLSENDRPVMWSPDGNTLLATGCVTDSSGESSCTLSTVDSTGSATAISNSEGAGNVIWEDSSSELYFSVSDSSGTRKTYKANPTSGSSEELISEGYAYRLSPDGKSLTFCKEATSSALTIVNTETKEQTSISDQGCYSSYWVDNDTLASERSYIGETDGEEEIYQLNTDGSVVANISNDQSASDSFDSVYYEPLSCACDPDPIIETIEPKKADLELMVTKAKLVKKRSKIYLKTTGTCTTDDADKTKLTVSGIKGTFEYKKYRLSSKKRPHYKTINIKCVKGKWRSKTRLKKTAKYGGKFSATRSKDSSYSKYTTKYKKVAALKRGK